MVKRRRKRIVIQWRNSYTKKIIEYYENDRRKNNFKGKEGDEKDDKLLKKLRYQCGEVIASFATLNLIFREVNKCTHLE